MVSGQLVWEGDHFAPIELAQLRADREQKAVAWFDAATANSSGNTKAALILLVVPEEAMAAGVLLPLNRVGHIDPPLGYGDGVSGMDGEGRYFESKSPTGRVKVLRNGVVDGISWLHALTDGTTARVDVDAVQTMVEHNVRAYLEVRHQEMHLGGRSWLVLSLVHADGLGAYNQVGQTEQARLATGRLAVPEVLVDTSREDPADALHKLFVVVQGAFGL